ncbi:hypothetical protein BIV59_16180 [Bacillus sp. MUM 13]|nr:hypothetical protein BIV59_16180 [Bacillus sp. MUM 13]
MHDTGTRSILTGERTDNITYAILYDFSSSFSRLDGALFSSFPAITSLIFRTPMIRNPEA